MIANMWSRNKLVASKQLKYWFPTNLPPAPRLYPGGLRRHNTNSQPTFLQLYPGGLWRHNTNSQPTFLQPPGSTRAGCDVIILIPNQPSSSPPALPRLWRHNTNSQPTFLQPPGSTRAGCDVIILIPNEPSSSPPALPGLWRHHRPELRDRSARGAILGGEKWSYLLLFL